LRGAKRRGNLMNIRLVKRLLRFARNDQLGICRRYTRPPDINELQKLDRMNCDY
jgi:hypothetical protein